MVRLGSLLFVALALISCGGAESPTAPNRDWIELNGVTPGAGTVLTAGESVTFTTTVTCTIATSEGGRVAMWLYDQGNRVLQTTPPSVTLARGIQTVTLTDTITIPPAGSTVTMATPLWINESRSTAAAKVTAYTVR